MPQYVVDLGRSGPLCAGVNWGFPYQLSQCVPNALQALTKRHLAPKQHKTTIQLVNPFLDTLRHRVLGLREMLLPFYLTDEWTVGKPAWKLRLIRNSHLFDALKHNSARSFIKQELHPVIKTKARLIQGHTTLRTAYHHSDEYCVTMKILKMLDVEGPVTIGGMEILFSYGGGKNHTQLSRFINDAIERTSKYRIFDERDGKNWDASMTQELLTAESEVYRLCGFRSTWDFLRRCEHVTGRLLINDPLGRKLVRYVTSWRRLSGDWNTSVGNTIVSMIVTWTTLLSLPEHLRPKKVFALFHGDDYLAVYDHGRSIDTQALKEALDAGEIACGITPERGIFRDPLAVSFVAMTLWPTFDGNFVFLPKPAVQLVKLFWSVRSRAKQDIPGYTTAIAICMWPLFRGFSLMEQHLKAHHVAKPNWGTLTDYWTMRYRTSEPLPPIQWGPGIVFKYGLPSSALYFPYPKGPGIWFHPAIKHMLEVEVLDPFERKACLTR